MAKPVRILHFVRGCDIGGVTTAIRTQIRYTNPERVSMIVAVWEGGHLGQHSVEATGCQVFAVGQGGQWSARTLANVVNLVRQYRVNIIHSHSSRENVFGALAAALTRATLVVSEHGIHRRRLGGETWNIWVERFALGKAAAIICNSHAMRSTTISVFPHLDRRNLQTVYIGVEDCFGTAGTVAKHRMSIRSRWNVGHDEICIGTMGNLTHWRHHDVLMHAFKLVKSRCQRTRLVLIGDGKERQTLERLSTSLRVDNGVVWTGWVPQGTDCLAGLDIYANPGVGEAFGIATVEAMLTQLPVVAANAYSLPELITDAKTGLLVEPLSPEHMADALVRLIENTSLRHELGLHARQTALRRFNPRNYARNWERIYERCLKITGVGQ